MHTYEEMPRRNRIYEFCPAEKAIWDATQKVEEMGAHPLLTDAVILLGRAREKVADFVDLAPITHCPKCNSHNPTLHPAVQFEGEVQICDHDWHKTTAA